MHAWSVVSQLVPATQSALVAHCFWQLPSGPQVYGAQLVVTPALLVEDVLSALHVEPCTHLLVAVSHLYVSAQSSSLVHAVKQALPAVSHANGMQPAGSGIAQPPLPSHAPCFWKRLSTVHESAPHDVVAPFAKPAHLSRTAPSHLVFAQSVALRVSHAERAPCGVPVAGVHVPSLPVMSHASHCPSHALSQQTPSTQ